MKPSSGSRKSGHERISQQQGHVNKRNVETLTTKASPHSPLPEPEALFSNNHFLVIHKPPGFHSQPNESLDAITSKKCLLSTLKGKGLGGGSNKDFLLPMHRLDQPCSGVLLLCKNSKAGTRVGNAFRKHLVQKDYFCVVTGDLETMIRNSVSIGNKGRPRMFKLTGVLQQSKPTPGGKGGKSVKFKPLPRTSDIDANGKGRICTLEWELLVEGTNNGLHLVRVRTDTGAKHQVRAMMAQLAKSPLCGDLRYGARSPLPDKSVALHARSLYLPTVSLGNMDFLREYDQRFIAPIPKTWKKYFKLTEEGLQKRGIK
jgi:23S rRNA pseudouridine1911/1915/1917 synthase